jgi:glutamate racemase
MLSAPILVLDSALAGLRLIGRLRERLPEERLLFFADVARHPYHVRSVESIERLVRQNLKFAGRDGFKHVVLGCDIASAVLAPLPPGWTGVIDPAARAAVDAAGPLDKPVIGVLSSTPAIERRALERALMKRRTRARLHLRPAHTLAMLAEEGRDHDDPLLLLAIEQTIRPLLDRACDVILLASTALCTIRTSIASVAGAGVRVVDVADAVADDVARRLTRARLLRPASSHAPHAPTLRWMLTDESPAIFDRAERLAGFELPPPTIVNSDDLDQLPSDSRLRPSA